MPTLLSSVLTPAGELHPEVTRYIAAVTRKFAWSPEDADDLFQDAPS